MELIIQPRGVSRHPGRGNPVPSKGLQKIQETAMTAVTEEWNNRDLDSTFQRVDRESTELLTRWQRVNKQRYVRVKGG